MPKITLSGCGVAKEIEKRAHMNRAFSAGEFIYLYLGRYPRLV